jgi:hypothetical protein
MHPWLDIDGTRAQLDDVVNALKGALESAGMTDVALELESEEGGRR